MQTRSSCSPSADRVPLVQFPAGHRREAQLQISDPNSFRGKIFPDWTVVNRPRSSSPSTNGSVDTYFIDPGTGREFPSLESVHRHLTGGEVDDRRLTREGHFFNEKTRAYEGSRTKQDHRSVEYASRGFRLPKGWTVEEFPRRNSNQIDKCYVERKTGKRFRSLVSVERYLKESGNRTDQQPKLLQRQRGQSKDFGLPDGWIVDEKQRRNSRIDKSYIEQGTGKKFRSLAAVERYLKASGNGAVDSGSNSMVHPDWLSLLGNRNYTEIIDPNPPAQVKWVFTGPGRDMFSANMSGSDVSGSVKQKWAEAFVLLIQDRS